MEKLLWDLLNQPMRLEWHLMINDETVDGRLKAVEKWEVTLVGGVDAIRAHQTRLAEDLGCPVYVRLVESRYIRL